MRNLTLMSFTFLAFAFSTGCHDASETKTLASQTPDTEKETGAKMEKGTDSDAKNEEKEDKGAQLPQKDLEGGLSAGEEWLKIVDKGNYGDSWEKGSLQFKTVVGKSDWETAMKKLRTPLGTVQSRKLADLRTAINPPGVAQGDYIVLVFNTDFSSRPKAGELVTLVKESDGNWRVMSYFAR